MEPPMTGKEAERFLKRWREGGDKAAMLRLLNHHNVATYDWDDYESSSRMQLCEAPANLTDLIGIYDIVFVQGQMETISTSNCTVEQQVSGSSFSRTAGGGTLSFQVQANGRVCGKVQDAACSRARRGECERLAQMSDLQFRQGGSSLFAVTKINGKKVRGHLASISGVLRNSGSFPWTPLEDLPKDEDDRAYIRFMQQKLQQQRERMNQYCNEEELSSSWLCTHMGLPVEVAQQIHAYNRHRLPPPTWEWHAGDIILFVTGLKSSTWFVARPREPATRDRLLRTNDNIPNHENDNNYANLVARPLPPN